VQLDRHLGDVRVRLFREDVVVDARVAAAEVGEPVLHLRVPRELVLGEAQRTVGVGETRAVGSLDGDAELRDVGQGEQAEADRRHQRHGAGDERGRQDHRVDGLGERTLERGHVVALDRAGDRLQRLAALAGLTLRAQHPAREEGNHRVRDEQRGEHGVEHRRGQ